MGAQDPARALVVLLQHEKKRVATDVRVAFQRGIIKQNTLDFGVILQVVLKLPGLHPPLDNATILLMASSMDVALLRPIQRSKNLLTSQAQQQSAGSSAEKAHVVADSAGTIELGPFVAAVPTWACFKMSVSTSPALRSSKSAM